jgi:hypothetical protein
MRILAICLLAAGCTENIYFADDEGGPRHDTSATGEHDDELSNPYAVGTSVGITIKGPVAGRQSGWSIVSDNAAVFTVDSKVDGSNNLAATGHAVAEGTARIRALDLNGKEQRSASVTVTTPTRARIFSHGQLRLVGNDDPKAYDAAEVSDVRVLVGGRAVFAVAYYKGDQRVYGRGIASVDSTIPVENHTSTGAPTNEWLFVTPAAAGAYTVSLKPSLASLNVTTVDETELADMSLAEEQGGSRNDKDQVWIVPRPHDASGHEVLGVYCDWTLDDLPQMDSNGKPAVGDLYRFHWDSSGAKKTLVAKRGAITATLAIPAHDGYVADTTYLGCSALPGSPGTRPTLVALVALFLLLQIRNRRIKRGAISPEIDAPTTYDRGR